ncbi:hypothetical protein D3C77_537620 [compost metagenome]
MNSTIPKWTYELLHPRAIVINSIIKIENVEIRAILLYLFHAVIEMLSIIITVESLVSPFSTLRNRGRTQEAIVIPPPIIRANKIRSTAISQSIITLRYLTVSYFLTPLENRTKKFAYIFITSLWKNSNIVRKKVKSSVSESCAYFFLNLASALSMFSFTLN